MHLSSSKPDLGYLIRCLWLESTAIMDLLTLAWKVSESQWRDLPMADQRNEFDRDKALNILGGQDLIGSVEYRTYPVPVHFYLF